MFKPPSFWQSPTGYRHPLAVLLSPVAALYEFVSRRKFAQTEGYQAKHGVICVGNATMGGVGKTPFSCLLSELLKHEGHHPVFLTRGYGGKEQGPILVNSTHDALAVGDEPLLLKKFAETCVSVNRAAGAAYIFNNTDADHIIMDDGLQNPGLKKDLSFLLVDGETGFGNGCIFPSGPLRERPETALSRVQAVVLVCPDKDYTPDSRIMNAIDGVPFIKAWLEAEPLAQAGQEVVAFSGIGRPEKFYMSAEKAGYKIVEHVNFPDHHAFVADDLAKLVDISASKNAPLLTTEKDFVRLPAKFSENVLTLPVKMRVDNEAALIELVSAAIFQEERS